MAAARRGGNLTLGASYLETAASGGRQNLLVKVDPGAPRSKSNKEAMLVDRWPYFGCQQLGRKAESVQGPTPLALNKQGVRAFIDRVGGGFIQSSLIGHQWSDFNWSSVV